MITTITMITSGNNLTINSFQTDKTLRVNWSVILSLIVLSIKARGKIFHNKIFHIISESKTRNTSQHAQNHTKKEDKGDEYEYVD